MLRTLRRLRWVAALAPALVVQTALADGPINCDPCPPLPCPAPCPAPAVARPRVVVHVPAPEVIIQNECSHVMKPRARLFGGHCNTCCGKTNQQQAQTQTILTPMSMTSFGSLGMFGANVQQQAVQMVPVQQAVQTVHAIQSTAEDFAGLRAIHEAEIRTASIVAARSRYDAELRSTLAALDRARVNITAAADVKSADCPTGTKELLAVATETVKTTTNLAKQLDAIQTRLGALEEQVREIRKVQAEQKK